uniref:DNA mismatch repair MutH/Type II restriction enzyme Sau3AI domain-containing protein n=1 Tax=viral metagenome TaxID=1070528 RepID=A0A6C0BY53_9ZZZZ
MNTPRITVAEIQSKLETIDWSLLDIPKTNKGERGQLIEIALGIPNSSALMDLADGELKTFTIGESIACTQLNHCLDEISTETEFAKSKVGLKMKQTVFIGFDKATGQCKGNVTTNEISHPEHHHQLQEDYEFICNKIRLAMKNETELFTINGPNKLLQIRTKASKNPKTGLYAPLMFNGKMLKNKGMAFYLCASFGKKLL